MDIRLKLFPPLSLKKLCLRKVAVLFGSNLDVLKFFYRRLHFRIPTCEIREWLEATEEKMSKLGLPESLNKQVIDRIQAIGFEIREWKENKLFRSEAEIELPDVSKLSWTTTGEIGDRKIAEQYVLCDRLQDWRRYEIACRNCMENHIPLLWNELSKEEKRFYKINWREKDLKYCWPYILEGEQSKLDDLWRESSRNLTSFNQWAFEESAKDDNQVAVEYFFQKLSPEEREVSFMRTAYGVTDGNVLFYLLSVMTPEQQMEMVSARPVNVLSCFLVWRRLHLLPENAGLIWTFLHQSDYGSLFLKINSLAYENKCFLKVFREFFKRAPLDLIRKSLVVHESRRYPPVCRVLCTLVKNEDSESIEVMFRHADAASRVKLLLHDLVCQCFYVCILEKWRGVEACLRGAALSEEDKDTLRESFIRFLDQRVSGTCADRRFRRFFKFLDETDACDEKERKVKRCKLD